MLSKSRALLVFLTRVMTYDLSERIFHLNSGYQGGNYEDGCRLSCSAVYTVLSIPMFQMSVLPPASGR
jgi:hypothetical protein